MKWAPVAGIGAALTFAATAAIGVLVLREIGMARADAATKLESVARELQNARLATWVDANAVPHSCSATDAEFRCTFTNTDEGAVTTCVRGSLTPNAGGETLKSLPACTGRIAARESKTIGVPWTGAFARDVCSSHRAYVGDVLDWAKCSFDVVPFDPSVPSTEVAGR